MLGALWFAVAQAGAVTRSWTNVLGGSWFVGSNWSPNGAPAPVDNLLITNNGTYSVVIATNAAAAASVVLGGTSGTQTLIQGTTTTLQVANVLDVRNNGVLVLTNAGFVGNLRIETGGVAQFSPAAGGLQLYHSTITNLGTVKWVSGSLSVGGSNSDTTSISNAGTWQILGDNSMNFGGGSRPVFVNSGILRKSAGAGQSQISGMDLINLAGGLVEVQSGTLRLGAFQTNVLGGTLTAGLGTTMAFWGGSCTDAGGITSGGGQFQFLSGNLYLRNNPIPGMKLLGGDVFLHPTTFQQAGAITNLTIDGAQLRGTNRVAGTLTFNGGSLVDRLTILQTGTLVAATTASKLLYSLTLINQGTVEWQAGSLAVGATPPTLIANSGLWQMSGDNPMNFGGGLTPWLTNSGTIRKIAGSGVSALGGCNLVNLSGGVVQVDIGAIALAPGSTNSGGEFRLNGGALQANGGFTINGTARVDGNGSLRQSFFAGGTLSPGLNGPGKIEFAQGLSLAGSARVLVEGVGVVPASQYDQLTVNGAVTLGGATLTVSSLPSVPVGTSFLIIDNDGTDLVSGTFDGLPENSLLTVSGQNFRIHYAGGTGNDVVLVRDTGVSAPTLTSGAYTQGKFTIGGLGGSSVAYTVLATTNFSQWTPIATVLSDPSGHISFTDTNASKFRHRFYRTTN